MQLTRLLRDMSATRRSSPATDAAPVERTSDGRFVVVNGRRWRATDPAIPANLATELRHELMDARRAVGRAQRAGDEPALAAARRRVGAAKHALGERGHPWWETADEPAIRARARATIDALLAARPTGTSCPSEIARVVAGAEWRPAMPLIREVVTAMAEEGQVVVTQRGRQVDAPYRGPIRIGRSSGGG